MFRLKRCDLLFVGCLGLSLFGLAIAAAPPADDAPIVYRGARIYTVAGPVIERGVLIVHKGRIAAVGPMATSLTTSHAVARTLAVLATLGQAITGQETTGRAAARRVTTGRAMPGPVSGLRSGSPGSIGSATSARRGRGLTGGAGVTQPTRAGASLARAG